jgi:tRNA-splicing endonuclease subunit Sen54
MRAVMGQTREYGADQGQDDDDDDDGLPLSLQAAYALLIGEDGEDGKISLDKFTVYANLKRSGYVVFRDRQWDASFDGGGQITCRDEGQRNVSLFTWLFGALFSRKPYEPPPYGPLTGPGLYRSYHQMYQLLSVIPPHKPSPFMATSSTPPQAPFRLVFDIWKPSRIPSFAKSKPGTPDVRVAVVSSRSTTVPSLTQLLCLVESTPWDPPGKEWTGPEKSYQRLKHGFRNVVLAIVDEGVTSYLRISEAAFGEEKLFSRFDGSKRGGARKGGGRGRGKGRGRGRGR